MVEDVVRCARCSRGSVQGVLRAPAEGEGGVAHREDLAATASATLERSTGTVAHGKRAARERRRRRSKVSRRRRAGHAPPARRGRRVRVPRAFKRPAKTLWWWWWWWWCAHQLRITSGRLPLCALIRSGEVFYFNIFLLSLSALSRLPLRVLSAVLAEKEKAFRERELFMRDSPHHSPHHFPVESHLTTKPLMVRTAA